MNMRTLGRTGIRVSEIGFGAWQLGNAKDWSAMADNDAIRLVHEALDRGCNFFDTAPNYGGGKSEELLGKAFLGKRDSVVINSKCGHLPGGGTSFSASTIVESVEGSLRRLQTDYLDSLLLHNPPFEDLKGSSEPFETLEKLKQEGKIRAYGASVDSGAEIRELLTSSNSDVIEIMYNIMHQEPASAMRLAEEQGVGLIVKVPLDSGWLSGKYNAASRFSGIRSRWSEEEIRTRSALVDRVRQIVGTDVSMIQAALRFILTGSEVSTIIPGVKDSEQLIENVTASNDRLPDDIVQRLRDLWEQEIKPCKLPW